jgi:hypothetical protein
MTPPGVSVFGTELEMITEQPISTKPKPFDFILMPLDPKLDDIYKFGIKRAAQDADAYAERVDEQIFPPILRMRQMD